MFKPRNNKQNKAIHVLVNKFKFSANDKAEMVADITDGRTESTKEMSFDEANVMIKRLGGNPFSANGQPQRTEQPRRTVNYHRQKNGVEQIASPTHRDHLNYLARERKLTAEGLENLSARVNKGIRTPRTSKEINRVIEAIKAMNARDKAAKTKIVLVKEAA